MDRDFAGFDHAAKPDAVPQFRDEGRGHSVAGLGDMPALPCTNFEEGTVMDAKMRGLTARQKQALTAWEDTSEDFDVLSFDTIAKSSGLARGDVRRTVRDMARRGYTRFYRGCWTDDGTPAGSGYGLTEKGRTAMWVAMDAAYFALVASATGDQS